MKSRDCALRTLRLISVMLQVEKTSKRHGGEIAAQVLKSHGIKHLFTLAGGHISPILAAAEKEGIKVIDTRHEVNGRKEIFCYFVPQHLLSH